MGASTLYHKLKVNLSATHWLVVLLVAVAYMDVLFLIHLQKLQSQNESLLQEQRCMQERSREENASWQREKV